MKHLIYLPIILIIICNAEIMSAQDKKIEEAEKMVVEWQKKLQIPGVSFAFQRGEKIYSNAFGYADLENKTPAKPESSYQIASVTKTMTALAILKLYEDGKINLDEEVQKYVSYFPKKKYPVTVRQLLAHTSGISHYQSDSKEEKHIKEPKSTKEAIDIFKDWDLIMKPGTKFSYSSYGYNLLGAVIEEVSGLKFNEYLKKNIWQPARMISTSLDNPIAIVPNRVRGYFMNKGQVENAEYLDISSRFGAGGVRSTVTDLLKLAKAMNSGKILKNETLDLMYTPVSDAGFNEYGLGVFVKPVNGQFRLMHGGGMPQTSAVFIMVPEEDFAFALMCNLGRQDTEGFGNKMTSFLTDLPKKVAMSSNDKSIKVILDSFDEIFNSGNGYYQKNRHIIPADEKTVESAFTYFNENIRLSALKTDFEKASENLKAGHQLHPNASFKWDLVGAYMASKVFNYTKGKSNKYVEDGALNFFSDYIELCKRDKSIPKKFHINSQTKKLIFQLKSDWEKILGSDLQSMKISFETNILELEKNFKVFEGKRVIPDYYPALADVGFEYMKQSKYEEADRIATLIESNYQNSFFSKFILGISYRLKGENDKSIGMLKEANAIKPRLNNFNWLGYIIMDVVPHNLPLALEIAEVAIQFNSKVPFVYQHVAELYAMSGNVKKAKEHLNTALNLNPNLIEAKAMLEKLK